MDLFLVTLNNISVVAIYLDMFYYIHVYLFLCLVMWIKILIIIKKQKTIKIRICQQIIRMERFIKSLIT